MGSIPVGVHTGGNGSMFVFHIHVSLSLSLPPSLPLPLTINKHILGWGFFLMCGRKKSRKEWRNTRYWFEISALLPSSGMFCIIQGKNLHSSIKQIPKYSGSQNWIALSFTQYSGVAHSRLAGFPVVHSEEEAQILPLWLLLYSPGVALICLV